jgi:hypothetical protein
VQEFEMDLAEIQLLKAYQYLIETWKNAAMKLIDLIPVPLVDAFWSPHNHFL